MKMLLLTIGIAICLGSEQLIGNAIGLVIAAVSIYLIEREASNG